MVAPFSLCSRNFLFRSGSHSIKCLWIFCLPCWLDLFLLYFGGLSNTGKKLFTWAVSVAWNAKSWTKFLSPAALTMFLQAAGSVFSLLNVWGKHTNLPKALQQNTPDVLGTNKSYVTPLQICLVCRLLVAAFSWRHSKACGRNNTCSWSNRVVL